MIIYFKVANYKSIKDPITLDFSATSISEHSESNLIRLNKSILVKSILLYGHNASGKSKLLDALVYFKWLINNSATEKQSNEKIDVSPFAFSTSTEKKASFFEICFFLGTVQYRYGFEANREVVKREWLIEVRTTTEYPLFLRINQELDIDIKRFENADGLEKRMRKNALFLSVASQWNVPKAEKINEWFANIITVHGLDDKYYRDFTLDLLKNKQYSKLVTAFIKKADLGINDIDVLDVPIKVDDIVQRAPEELREFFKKQFVETSQKAVFALHNKYNAKKDIVDSVPLLLDHEESEGTRKYFNLIGVLIISLLENRVVIIDEFDARLHTLLTKAILKLFNSSIIDSQAQLIAASHDTALLDREILRRDQIYFIEKDKFGASSAVSLVEYKSRKETPYDKNYLEGKYGATPFIDDLEKLFNDGKKK